MEMDSGTVEKIVLDVIVSWGSTSGPVDLAAFTSSISLAGKIIGTHCVGNDGPSEARKLHDIGKIIRTWALIQKSTRVDLGDVKLAKNLVKCILENVNGRKEDRRKPSGGGQYRRLFGREY